MRSILRKKSIKNQGLQKAIANLQNESKKQGL
jgi:hypothetical protein